MTCPAGATAKCPLYIESHRGTGRGCVDDMLQPCLVRRGEMDFQQAVLELAADGRDGTLELLNVIGGRH